MLHVNIKTGHGERSLPLAVGVSLAVAVDMSGFGDVETRFKSWSYIYVIVVCDSLVFYVYDNTSVIFVQDFNFDPHQSREILEEVRSTVRRPSKIHPLPRV